MSVPYFDSIRKPLDGFYNLRDLGGLPTKDGQITKFGRYLRSDAPVNLGTSTLDYLDHFPVELSLDLRTSSERNSKPSSLHSHGTIREAHTPLIEDSQMASFFHALDASSGTILGDFYIHLLDHNAERFAMVFRQMATVKSGAVLFHCQQGKDRTGIISALILMLGGVRNDDIIANYEVSYSYLKPSLEPKIKRYPDNFKQLLRSDHQNMEKMLDHFYQRHHSARSYLENAGCSSEVLDTITERLM